MESLDFHHELEQTMKDLLQKSCKVIDKKITKFKEDVLSSCDKMIDQSQTQLDLKTSLVGYNNNIKDAFARQSTQKLDDSIQKKKVLIENELEEFKNSQENLQTILNQQIKEKSDLCQANDKKLKEVELKTFNITNHVSMYKEHLGLEIRPLKNNRIQFVFNNFHNDSADIVYVIVRLSSRVYTILETEPELDDVKKLEETLNQTNNLAGFIQKIRKMLFEKLCV